MQGAQHYPSSTTKDFKRLWNEGNAEDRQRIMKLILERVWVHGENMVALLIRPQYLIWVREGLADRKGEAIEPANLPPFIIEKYAQKKGNFRFLESYRCGSDGRRLLSGNFFYVFLLIPVTR